MAEFLKKFLLVSFVGAFSAAQAFAAFTVVGTATCKKGGGERRVSMRLFGTKVPCDVIFKDSGDGFKKLHLLTDSKTDASVCTTKFHDAQKELKAVGYNCAMGKNPGGAKASVAAPTKASVVVPKAVPAPISKVVPSPAVKVVEPPAVPPATPPPSPRVPPTPPPGGEID
jgi:hypothetical protein